VSPAQTNIPVHNLAELQDIDDLVVEEGTPPPAPTDVSVSSRSSPAGKAGSGSAASARKSGSLARTASDAESGRVGSGAEGGREEEEEDDKYAKKGNPLYRLFVQVAPENMVRSLALKSF